MDPNKVDNLAEARRLRELFRGRFDQETAVKLITEFGGLLPAVDFVLNEGEETVSHFLKKSSSYLQSLRDDSKKLASLLENKIESSVRQFVCKKCHQCWWKKVPLRKEVSKCRKCHVKYDPLPREHESGIGSFKCPCGNEFTGFATMSETLSECYTCHTKVPVDCILPPRKNRGRKSKKPHSCNGVNCYNSKHNHDLSAPDLSQIGSKRQSLQSYPGADLDRYMTSSTNMVDMTSPITKIMPAHGRRKQVNIQNQHNYVPDVVPAHHQPVCVHPKSQKRVIRHFSQKHISTGSTVSTCLSQSSIQTESMSVASSLCSIVE